MVRKMIKFDDLIDGFALKLEIVLFRYKIIKMMYLFYIIIIICKKI